MCIIDRYCDKALFHLRWKSTLDYELTHQFVSEWYHEFYLSKQNMFAFTISQITDFSNMTAKNEIECTICHS